MSYTLLPLDQIHAGRNPRSDFNDDTLAELAASIKQDGVLDPVRVVPNDNGYRLESGERRFRAAKLAGLAEIPCIIVSKGESVDEYIRAIVTNVQREDMNPVDECRAYNDLIEKHGLTEDGVAERLGVSRTRVTQRLQLRNLPVKVLQHYYDRKLRLDCRLVLQDIANVSEELAIAVADLVAGQDEYGAVLAKEPMRVVGYVVKQAAEGQKEGAKPKHGWFLMPGRHLRGSIPLKKSQAEAAKGFDTDWNTWNPDYTLEDLQTAAAVGVAYMHGDQGVCVDPVWMRDHFDVIYKREVDAREQRRKQHAEQEAAAKAAKIDAKDLAPETTEKQEVEKEFRRQEREAIAEAKKAARAANLELGRKLYTELKVDVGKLDLASAQVIVHSAITRSTSDLFLTGLRYCFAEHQTEDDKGRVDYVSGVVEAGNRTIKFLDVKDPAELVRRALIVFACAAYADQGAVSQSQRFGQSLADRGGGGGSQQVEAMPVLKPLLAAVKDVVPAASRGKQKPSEKVMAKFQQAWARAHQAEGE